MCGQDGVDMVEGCKVSFKNMVGESPGVRVYYVTEKPRYLRSAFWASPEIKSFNEAFRCGSVFSYDPIVTRLCERCVVRAGFIW